MAADIASLTTHEEILALLRTCEQSESQVEGELDALLADAATLGQILGRLEGLAPTVASVEREARDVAARIDNTAQVAERISGQVRVLDDEQSKVKASIETVQAVQDLKVAIALTSDSVDKRDWETATRHMQRALAVDQKIVKSSFAEAVVPTSDIPQPPAQAIQELRAAMLDRFLSEFQSASTARDEANTSRYFKLFPMIAAEEEGLSAYADFVCSLVATRPKPGFNASKPMYFASLITPLFEHIALIISQHQPVVDKYYGPSKMLPVAVKLQQECDRQGMQVLAQWQEERRLNKKLVEAKSYRFQALNALASGTMPSDSLYTPPAASLQQSASQQALAQLNMRSLNASLRQVASGQSAFPSAAAANPPPVEEPMVDVKEVDGVLQEIAQISGRWQLFRRFLYARLSEEHVNQSVDVSIDTASGPDTHLPTAEAPPTPSLAVIENSSFKEALQGDLTTYYEPLELWYFRLAVEKAHSLDEPDFGSRPTTSSVLDDVFFMLKKVVGRTLSTSNAEALESIVKKLKTILERDFAGVLKRRLDSLLTQMNANRVDRERALYVTYLNNLDLAAEYTHRLMQGFLSDQSLEQAFFVGMERVQAEAGLHQLQASDEQYKTCLKTGVDQLFNALIRPKLRPLVLDCYRDVSYVLDEDAYSEAEFNDVVRKRFIRGWSILLDSYKETMTENNFRSFFSLAVTLLVRPWEATLKGMRFSELGALRLDRDLRSVVSFLSEQVPFGTSVLRDAFARLQQIATLLSADAEDVAELVTSNGWRLSQSEMNGLLSLKV